MDNKGNNNNNGGNGGNGGNNKNGMTVMVFVLAALLVLFLTSLLNSCARDATNKEITYSEFVKMVEEDKVEEVTFTSSRIKIVPKGQDTSLYRISYYTAELRDEELLPLLREHNVKFGGEVEDVSTTILWNFVSYILPLVLVWVLLYFLIFRKLGGGGMMGVGKTTAKVYVEKSTGVTFKDVAGQDEAKESLQEVVDFLHNPKRYTDIGAKLPKGALLVGPPGTGKTLLAKAVAGEANVPFFSLAGSDFVEMFVGVGASRVRDLFKEAQKQAPCIIFIDEIDAIGKSRDTRYGGNDEREQTLNQLLAEMDGFDTSKGLLILAATNRPEVLDKALLRPGRFDRRIIVDKPDLKGRVETLKVHAKNVLMDETVDLDAIALATSGAVGSDLANMINEAAINAVKQGRKYVNQGDLFESVEVVIAGKEKKDRIMGPKEKKMVAYHEVGHALVTALQKDAEPVQKITIVPRTMGALGYTMQVPEEEKYLMTRNELIAHLVTYMGGRAAEEIVFESVTTGASNDIEQATKMARAMVTQYGMSEKFGLMGLVTVESQYLDGRASLNCGEETAAQIDQEVMRILKECYDTAVRLLQENRSILDEISQYLYEHETITGKEFMKIFRNLKGIPEPEEKTDAEKAAEEFKAEGSQPKKSWRREPQESPMDAYVREREGRSAAEAILDRNAPGTESYVEMGAVPQADSAKEQMIQAGDVPKPRQIPFEPASPLRADMEEESFSMEAGEIGAWEAPQEPGMREPWEGVAGMADTPKAWEDIRRGIASRTKAKQEGESFGDIISSPEMPQGQIGDIGAQDGSPSIQPESAAGGAGESGDDQGIQAESMADGMGITKDAQEAREEQAPNGKGTRVENLKDAFLVAAMQEESLQNLPPEKQALQAEKKPGRQKDSNSRKKNTQKKESPKEEAPSKGKKAQGKKASKSKTAKSDPKEESPYGGEFPKKGEAPLAKESRNGQEAPKKEEAPLAKESRNSQETPKKEGALPAKERRNGQGFPKGIGNPSAMEGAQRQEEPPKEIFPQMEGFSQEEAGQPADREDYLDRLLKGMK